MAIPREGYVASLLDKPARDEATRTFVADRIARTLKAIRDHRGLNQKDVGRLMTEVERPVYRGRGGYNASDPVAKAASLLSNIEMTGDGGSVKSMLAIANALDLPLVVDFPSWDDWLRMGPRINVEDRDDFQTWLRKKQAEDEAA